MARNLKELFREAAELPEKDRATLAALLIESLEGEPDAEWREPGRRKSNDDSSSLRRLKSKQSRGSR
ncbi:MAG TPA: hypothetical protein VGQ81_00190 [Acidobacteriota bacterium]|nr:hypothetical protein [Acidobacteriota bacterium]